ncbi:short-chain dehydrogenase [Endozoicomonas montiporae]|uniref:Short-chain dehydrogenase n=2 Tax=Endozoicomonas montiporae TaxID=1027273 RepID=A0A081N4E4_9GAMM|nr:SDR family oxidoreductase [Endozoicomonas montiporae]AMO57836.1 short-chain dehydrogenase/reductase SDR [Endozoicomonas montiporae CL-33]KEQ13317.1 short-chain dehydrogenase [Endozoicomonas montiporae]
MSKIVVITGANRGLGLEFCKQYLADGDKVYACCRAPESAGELLKLKQDVGDRLETIPLDVTNAAQLTNLKYTLQGQRIDLLINNAGIYGERLPFGEVTEQEWMQVLQINTVSPLLVVQELVELMAADGKILLMSSIMGSIADNTSGGSYIYRSSKAALNAVGKSLAHDLSGKGISVAICHPGWVQTDMGGPNALINTETSIGGLRNVMEQLTLETSGQFFKYDGSVIPW